MSGSVFCFLFYASNLFLSLFYKDRLSAHAADGMRERLTCKLTEYFLPVPCGGLGVGEAVEFGRVKGGPRRIL